MTDNIRTYGSRAQVWHKTATKTSGGLTKRDLIMNKSGRIVSKSKHFSAKKDNRLLKHGYGTKKGTFGFVKVGSRRHRKGTNKMRGGMYSLSPMELGQGIDGQGLTNYGSSGSVGVQLAAGMAGGSRMMARGGSRMMARGGSRMMARGGSGMMPMRGGSGMMPMSPMELGQGIDGQGLTNYGSSGSVGVQLAAGMAGGKRKNKRRHRSRGMAGGTGNRSSGGVGSDALQFAAGNAN